MQMFSNANMRCHVMGMRNVAIGMQTGHNESNVNTQVETRPAECVEAISRAKAAAE